MAFCENCGAPVSENASFCRNCGVKIAVDQTAYSPLTAVNQSLQGAAEYDREAIKQYLFDLRFLECAKNRLANRWYEENRRVESLGHPGTLPYKPSDNEFACIEWENVGYSFLFAIICVISGWLINLVVEWIWETRFFLFAGVILGVVFATIAIVSIITDMVEADRQRNEYDAACEADEKRVERELLLKEEAIVVRDLILQEYNESDSLLQRAYSLNIIPKSFREIHAIYYLYDFMSTSNESFQSALLFSDLDEIKQKLDTIISQNNQIIINQAIQIAQNQYISDQNQQMLKRLSDIESNTDRSAKYSEIAAVNAEACAWIGIANYIKD